jgi:hypothetical protein
MIVRAVATSAPNSSPCKTAAPNRQNCSTARNQPHRPPSSSPKHAKPGLFVRPLWGWLVGLIALVAAVGLRDPGGSGVGEGGGSAGRGRWWVGCHGALAGQVGECSGLGERVEQLFGPGPGALQPQPLPAGVAGDARGDVQDPVAQGLGLGDGEVAVQGEPLGPRE